MLENFLPLKFVFSGDHGPVANAAIARSAHHDAGMQHQRKFEKLEHLLESRSVVQVSRAIERKASIVKLMVVNESHRAIFDFDPLDQIPLKQADPHSSKVLKDRLVAG